MPLQVMATKRCTTRKPARQNTQVEIVQKVPLNKTVIQANDHVAMDMPHQNQYRRFHWR